MESWLNHAILWWHWVLLGIILSGLEMLVTSFFLLWLGVSAVLVGIILWLIPISVQWQLFLWAIFSFGCLLSWFKFVAPKMRDRSKAGMAYEALLGQVGTVLSVTDHRGQLRFPAPILGEDEWRFICREPVKVGDKVSVVNNSGNDLIVEQLNTHTE